MIKDLWGIPKYIVDNLSEKILFFKRKFEFYEKTIRKNVYKYLSKTNDGLTKDTTYQTSIKPGNIIITGLINQVLDKENYRLIEIHTLSERFVLRVNDPTKIKDLQYNITDYERLIPGVILGFHLNVIEKIKEQQKEKAITLNALEHYLATVLNQDSYKLSFINLVYPEAVTRNYEDSPDMLPVKAVLLADIHVGSKTFIRPNFETLLTKINKDLKVKYVIIAGDSIDGLGVYPAQKHDLLLLDYIKQYRLLGELLGILRKDIWVIISPGNHDYVSKVEPQIFSKEAQQLIGAHHENTVFVSNPCYLELEGKVKYLLSHGTSLNSLIEKVADLSYSTPATALKQIIHLRNICPIVGAIPIQGTTDQNYHVVPDKVDIFHTGHLHRKDHVYLRDILLVSSSAWQHVTPYQQMLNFKPTFADAYVVNLNNLKELDILDCQDSYTDDYRYEIAELKDAEV